MLQFFIKKVLCCKCFENSIVEPISAKLTASHSNKKQNKKYYAKNDIPIVILKKEKI